MPAKDIFPAFGNRLETGVLLYEAAKSDTVDLPYVSRQIRIKGAAGDIRVRQVFADATYRIVTYPAALDEVIDIAIDRWYATGSDPGVRLFVVV